MAPSSSAETAPLRFGAAASAPLQEALCLPSLQSSSFSLSSLQWVEAASFLHCGNSSDSTFQPNPRWWFRHCPDSVCVDSAIRWRPLLQDHAKLAWMEPAQCEATRARCGGRLIVRSLYRSTCRLWHLSCSPHWAPHLPSGQQPCLISRPSSSPSPETWLADVAGLAAERAFDYDFQVCLKAHHQQSGECIYMQNMPTHRLMHILHMLCMFIAYFFCILSIFFACFFPYNLHICYVEVYVMAYFMHILCIYLHIYCIFIAYLYILYAYFCILNAFFVHI